MKAKKDRNTKLCLWSAGKILVLALLTLVLASCGEGLPGCGGFHSKEQDSHEELLEKTRDCLNRDPLPAVADATGAHWSRAQRLVREDRIPKEPLLLGVMWVRRDEDATGPFALAIAWLKRERPPSSIRKMRLRVGDKNGDEQYEFVFPSSGWHTDCGYVWYIEETMSLGDVSGVETGEPIDTLGTKLLHLKISEETFERGVWLSLVDEQGRSSNYLKIRTYSEWKKEREEESSRE